MKHAYTTALLSALATSAQAHSWVEQLMIIASNGTLVGQPGFPRGFVQRTAPGFSDTALVNLMPPNDRTINDIRATDPICKQGSQTSPTQTNGSPRLKAAAGANIALRHQENGHVTLPQNQPGKPDNRGTIYVYGTTDSKPDDSLLSIHRVWTPDGQGGDKRGVLLSTRNYDDGQCYQVNGQTISQQRQKQFAHPGNSLMGGDLWCQSDIRIPANAPSGKPYALYWVWDWPTLPGTEGFPNGKQEIYTTCMDVDVTGADTSAIGESGDGAARVGGASSVGAAINFVTGQDIANAGIAAQLSNIVNPTAIQGKFIPFSGQNAPSASAAAPSSSIPKGAASASSAVVTSAAPGKVTTTSIAALVTSTLAPQSDISAQPSGRRTRPSVAPIPAPSPSTPVAPSAAQNTGTAISNANGNRPVSVTVNGFGGATVTQVQTLISTILQTKIETVTAPSPSGISKREVPCSKTEHAYLLRARNAFYIVPHVNEC